ncbi:MAG: hypothetical protein HRT67_13115 [Flavobacteriaceae bacterium]|nr:hypothetical protein [Flavobacteriaceae bacterium]
MGNFKFGKKRLIIGSLIATVIASSPFLFYLHKSVPKTQVWDTFLFRFESHFYENANTAMWATTQKLYPLLLLFIWFFTCRHWWYHAILVPICMYVFQFFSLITLETHVLDEFEIIYLTPIMAIIVPSIYLLRARMFNRINDVDKSMEDLEKEFMMTPTNFWDKVKRYF